jgi:hypothetical protein
MHVPQSMKSLTAGFHQDIFEIEPTLEGAVSNAIGFLSHADKLEAKAFLQEILDGEKNASRVREIWDVLPKDIRIDRDEEVVKFLKYILEVLSREG